MIGGWNHQAACKAKWRVHSEGTCTQRSDVYTAKWRMHSELTCSQWSDVWTVKWCAHSEVTCAQWSDVCTVTYCLILCDRCICRLKCYNICHLYHSRYHCTLPPCQIPGLDLSKLLSLVLAWTWIIVSHECIHTGDLRQVLNTCPVCVLALLYVIYCERIKLNIIVPGYTSLHKN